MPTLLHENAIKQYYEEVKDKYPNVTFEQFDEVCRSPFNYIKFCMKDKGLPIILMKYLGKFRVFPQKVLKRLATLKIFHSKGWVSDEDYNKEYKFLNKYLDDLSKEDDEDFNFDIIDDNDNEHEDTNTESETNINREETSI